MDKLLDFGRRALFVVRVLTGYEERRIRAYRMQLQKRIEQAQAQKLEMRKKPEQAILSEVRRMVEEMQALNHKLEETEAAIENYFKPIDKNAEMIMNLQLEKEEKQMKEMMKTMQEHALLQRAESENAKVGDVDASQQTQDVTSPTQTKHGPNGLTNTEHSIN